jgi:hypothetical protein
MKWACRRGGTERARTLGGRGSCRKVRDDKPGRKRWPGRLCPPSGSDQDLRAGRSHRELNRLVAQMANGACLRRTIDVTVP